MKARFPASQHKYMAHTLHEEQGARRSRYRDSLARVDNMSKLSPEQRRLLRLSLYIQERRDRKYADYYSRINQFALETNCHIATYYLENPQKVPIEPSDEELDSFLHDGFDIYKNLTYSELHSYLQALDCPSLVQVASPSYRGKPRADHSLVVLEEKDATDFYIWEKKGYCGAFVLTTLSDLYNECGSFKYRDQYWCIRPLKIAR